MSLRRLLQLLGHQHDVLKLISEVIVQFLVVFKDARSREDIQVMNDITHPKGCRSPNQTQGTSVQWAVSQVVCQQGFRRRVRVKSRHHAQGIFSGVVFMISICVSDLGGPQPQGWAYRTDGWQWPAGCVRDWTEGTLCTHIWYIHWHMRQLAEGMGKSDVVRTQNNYLLNACEICQKCISKLHRHAIMHLDSRDIKEKECGKVWEKG